MDSPLTEAIHPILHITVKVGDRGLISGDGPNNVTGSWDRWTKEITVRTIFQSGDKVMISDRENSKTGYYLSHFRPLVGYKRRTIREPIYATLK